MMMTILCTIISSCHTLGCFDQAMHIYTLQQQYISAHHFPHRSSLMGSALSAHYCFSGKTLGVPHPMQMYWQASKALSHCCNGACHTLSAMLTSDQNLLCSLKISTRNIQTSAARLYHKFNTLSICIYLGYTLWQPCKIQLAAAVPIGTEQHTQLVCRAVQLLFLNV